MNAARSALAFLALALLGAATPAASAEMSRRGFTGTVDFAQHLDRALPAGLEFRDERGRTVRLGDYLGAGPLGLIFFYYGCSNLCPMQIHNLAQRLTHASGTGAEGTQMLVVSIDPLDSPALADRAKHRFLDELLPPDRIDRWHFLTGAPGAVAQLTEAVGFTDRYDPATHQYAHPAGFTVVTEEGKIARYFFGFDFTADELGQALDEAAALKVGTPIERLLLVCFHYDLLNGPYSALIFRVLRIASIVMLFGAMALGLILRARRLRAMES